VRVTAFVATIGAQTFPRCLAALESQPCIVDVIANVSPWAAAQNEMLKRCTTELFVQVDEDMILHPGAISQLVELIDSTAPTCVMACAPLWDVDLDMAIYGCKIYRHALVAPIPFEPHVLGDTHDREVWARHGLTWSRSKRTRENCVGLHGTHYTPEQAFARWRGLWQRHRMTGKAPWIEPWLSRLGERYRASGSRLDLYAFAGALIGATEALWSEDRGPDARRPDEIIATLGRVL
jgi:hypothetical protein